jgi:hypothetical protein
MRRQKLTWNIAQTAQVTEPGGWHYYDGSQDCKKYMRVQCQAPNGQMSSGEQFWQIVALQYQILDATGLHKRLETIPIDTVILQKARSKMVSYRICILWFNYVNLRHNFDELILTEIVG